jgi:hypothetical protein
MKYRIKQVGDDEFYPEVRHFGFWWTSLSEMLIDCFETFEDAKWAIELHKRQTKSTPVKYFYL